MPKAHIIVNAVRRDKLPASPEYLARFREALVAHNGRSLVGTDYPAATMQQGKS